jgi:hypothetical protein
MIHEKVVNSFRCCNDRLRPRIIADDLADVGIETSDRRVGLCFQQRIWAVFAKKLDLRSMASLPVHDDLVERNFDTSRANELW